jgi:hypothetical protein
MLLVSVDVESLYPSIPQTDMLETIYQEMSERRHLLIFDHNVMMSTTIILNLPVSYSNRLMAWQWVRHAHPQ